MTAPAARWTWPKRVAVPPHPLTGDPARRVWLLALAAAAVATGVSPFALARADTGRHGGDVARARDLAIYLTVVEGGLDLGAAGRLAGISKQAVHKTVKRLEDRRDDPAFDAALTRAEGFMREGTP